MSAPFIRAESAQRQRPPPQHLTAAEIAELSAELRYELRRLTPSGAMEGAPLGERARTRLQLILDAQSRIRAGNYGVCVDCRAPIAYERLAAIPETKNCVGCGWARHVEQGVPA